mmetsp:Transcript_1879/g.4911  ORF Transcript_1879/g.4911 Transcript_1879/m.4911 type:complete len:118 (+) Transcript_1879:336-689(+)
MGATDVSRHRVAPGMECPINGLVQLVGRAALEPNQLAELFRTWREAFCLYRGGGFMLHRFTGTRKIVFDYTVRIFIRPMNHGVLTKDCRRRNHQAKPKGQKDILVVPGIDSTLLAST